MAFWTLDELNEAGGLDLERVGDRFSAERIFGIGHTVREWSGRWSAGIRWPECGVHSAGNGALMRIAPVLIPHLRNPSPDLWVDAVKAASLTHNDAASNAVSVAWIAILWDLLANPRNALPESGWWLSRYLEIAGPLEGPSEHAPKGGALPGFRGPITEYVGRVISAARDQDPDTGDESTRMKAVLRSWYSGAYLLETVPAVLWICENLAHDPESAILHAVNLTKDNDTVAAIVGSAMGALHGESGLPTRWIENLTGRTGADDDGMMFQILDEMEDAWL
jgi:ADP-ribosylglycohydrolase